jgi:hypothetical protein
LPGVLYILSRSRTAFGNPLATLLQPKLAAVGGAERRSTVLGGTRSANARALRLIPVEGVRGRLHGQITRRG